MSKSDNTKPLPVCRKETTAALDSIFDHVMGCGNDILSWHNFKTLVRRCDVTAQQGNNTAAHVIKTVKDFDKLLRIANKKPEPKEPEKKPTFLDAKLAQCQKHEQS